jgi:hypothetical protein
MPYEPRLRVVAYDDAGLIPGADKTYTYPVDSLNKLAVSVLNSATTQINCNIDVSELEFLALICTVGGKVETNGVGASAGDSVTLSANVPRVWSADIGGTNPFATEDVVTLHFTNSGPTVGVLRVVAGVDPTP